MEKLTLEELIPQLKRDIIEGLNLVDVKEENIGDDMSLFEGGLELDSLDALELVFMIDKKYNVKVTDQEEAIQIFVSVRTIAEFIIRKRE